ncbi:MAG: hypothetical protein ABSG85_16080 [Spirochaetia bacterium]
MLRRSLSLARNTIKLYLSDPVPLMVFIFMPLGLMAFLAPASRALLQAQGYAHAGGAEQAVPGMTVMFSFFVIGVIGIQFYREQGWARGTGIASPLAPWRSSSARSPRGFSCCSCSSSWSSAPEGSCSTCTWQARCRPLFSSP